MNAKIYNFFRLFQRSKSIQSIDNKECSSIAGNRMKAWQIHSYGDISELQLSQARLPVIATSTELQVKVTAASINPIDYAMLNGYAKTIVSFLRKYELEFPLTLGRDFCGTIVDKGQEVDNKYNIGDTVYGVIPIQKQGTLQETIIVDQSFIRHKPEKLSNIEASSILYGALTAWSALFLTGGLCNKDLSKQRVLILGASGGVGTVAVQMLKSQNATVVGSSSPDAFNLLQSLGIDAVFNYSDVSFAQQVADAGPYDIILDCAKYGHENIPANWKYTTFVTLNSPLMTNTDTYGLFAGFLVSGINLLSSNITKLMQGKSVRWGYFHPAKDGIDFIDKIVKSGKLNPVIHNKYKFEEVPEAFKEMERGHLRGKIVIDYE